MKHYTKQDLRGGIIHRYHNEKGKISMTEPHFGNFNTWEIYCLEGDLFEDCERYDTQEEALQRVKEILGVKQSE